MYYIKKNRIIFYILIVILNNSCVQDNSEPKDLKEEQKQVLKNIGDNLAWPIIKNLNKEVDSLRNKIKSFTQDPRSSTLNEAQKQFKTTYKIWQKSSVFVWDKQNDQFNTRKHVNSFNTKPDKIKQNVKTGDYNFDFLSIRFSKGFPAIDYLLFSTKNNNNKILERYTSDSLASDYKAYLNDVVKDVDKRINKFFKHWSPDHNNYISTFKSSTGTDLGSGLSKLVNGFIFDTEIVKNEKLGLPIGIYGKENQNTINPTWVEGYYSGISKSLVKVDFEAIKKIYLGIGKDGNDGKGLYEHLKDLDAKYNGGSLADTIKAQINIAEKAIDNLPDQRLSKTIKQNKDVVMNPRNQVQKLVILLKSDMTQAMGISISYPDNDGD